MSHKVRIAGVTAALVCAAGLAACSGDPDDSDGATITVTTMRGAFLQPAEIGATWQPPTASADPNQLVALCPGPAAPPPLPPGAEVISAPLADEGQNGAQTLHQTALVYPDEAGAEAGLESLRALADTCPASVDQAAQSTAGRNEPAYTESFRRSEMSEGGWNGFVVQRHKQYEAAHPGVADTAVAVVSKANVVIVDAYAVYRLGNASTGPQFDADWKKLVGTVLNRVG